MEILKTIKDSDGSVYMHCELSPLEVKVIKRHLGVKKLTKKRLTQFFQKAIIKGTKKDTKEVEE